MGEASCVFCGVEASTEAVAALEPSIDGWLATAPRGLGLPGPVVRCNACGATLQWAANEGAKACALCGSNAVSESENDPDSPQPVSLVLFSVTRAEAEEAFQQWLPTLSFTPGDLASRATIERLEGVYVPFWLLEAEVSTHCTAEVGIPYETTSTQYEWDSEEGSSTRSETVTSLRWMPATATRSDRFDMMLVSGSRGLPSPLMAQLSRFHVSKLVAYSPAHLADRPTEPHAADLLAAWQSVLPRIKEEQRERCVRELGGKEVREVRLRNTLMSRTFRPILRPVWIGSYRYRDKSYRFFVDGLTRHVIGDETPLSAAKTTGMTLLVVGFLGAIVWLLLRYGGAVAHFLLYEL